jgi:D-3-phosphoglycerate dehydrogenase
VTEQEPLPPTSRLWDLPNVVITPHVGAQSRTRYDDATRLFCENLQRYLRGEGLRNEIDKVVGFPRREEGP